jgi:hypothetical protein
MTFLKDHAIFWVAVGASLGAWLAMLWLLGMPQDVPVPPTVLLDDKAARAWQFRIACGTGERAVILAHTLARRAVLPAEGDMPSVQDQSPRRYQLYSVEGSMVLVGQTDAMGKPVGEAVVVENLGPQGVYLNTVVTGDTAVALLAPGDMVELGDDVVTWAASLRCPDPVGATVKVTALPSE